MAKIYVAVLKTKLDFYEKKIKTQKEEIEKLKLELKYYKEKDFRSSNSSIATEIELRNYKAMYENLKKMFLNYIHTGKMEE